MSEQGSSSHPPTCEREWGGGGARVLPTPFLSTSDLLLDPDSHQHLLAHLPVEERWQMSDWQGLLHTLPFQ